MWLNQTHSINGVSELLECIEEIKTAYQNALDYINKSNWSDKGVYYYIFKKNMQKGICYFAWHSMCIDLYNCKVLQKLKSYGTTGNFYLFPNEFFSRDENTNTMQVRIDKMKNIIHELKNTQNGIKQQ